MDESFSILYYDKYKSVFVIIANVLAVIVKISVSLKHVTTSSNTAIAFTLSGIVSVLITSCGPIAPIVIPMIVAVYHLTLEGASGVNSGPGLASVIEAATFPDGSAQ
jgi:hypothetical protein